MIMPDEIRQLLLRMFCAQNTNDMSMHRLEALYSLASEIQSGLIVELGTAQGAGAITMALAVKGRPVSVETIDDFMPRHGWSGPDEVYGPENYSILSKNATLADVRPRVHVGNIQSIGLTWPVSRPIDLLYVDVWHDLGDYAHNFLRHIKAGGIVAVHECIPGQMGGKQLLERLVASGEYNPYAEYHSGCIYCVKRNGAI